MNLTFPTRPHGPSKPGLPERAQPCRCRPAAFIIEIHETCQRCGHYETRTIEITWRQRAEQISRRGRRPDAQELAA